MLKHENCPAMIPATHLNLVYKIPYRRAHGLAFRPSARASKGILHINLNHLIADVKNLGARKYHKSFRVISLRTVGCRRRLIFPFEIAEKASENRAQYNYATALTFVCKIPLHSGCRRISARIPRPAVLVLTRQNIAIDAFHSIN